MSNFTVILEQSTLFGSFLVNGFMYLSYIILLAFFVQDDTLKITCQNKITFQMNTPIWVYLINTLILL